MWSTLLETVSNHSARESEPAFHRDPHQGVRFFRLTDGASSAISFPDALRLLSPRTGEWPVLWPATMPLRLDPGSRQAFLAGDAHEALAFRQEPLLSVHLRSPAKTIVFAREGRVGRKYARSKTEMVDFLSHHPEAKSVFSDVGMRFGVSIKTVEDLSDFIDQEGRLQDAVIDAVAMTSGYLFDPDTFGDSIAAKEKWFLERHPDGYATVDFFLDQDEVECGPLAPLVFAPAKEALTSALRAISSFADRHNLPEDRAYFETLLLQLNRTDLQPPALFTLNRLPSEAYALYRTAVGADVFAGMASWNDVPIEKTREYREVSNRLCLALLDALCASCSAGL